MKNWKRNIFSAVLASVFALSAHAGTLVINADTSDPAPKKAFEELVAAFEKAHPNVEVKTNIYDHEAYKTAIRNWLTTSPPDVVYWYAGNRMAQFVDKGLFEDVSDIWREDGLDQSMASAMPAMTIEDKQWGVPYTYYQWGVYYRKDLFEKHGLSEPKTYEELLALSKTLKDNGINPVAIGTKYLWTAAGWFDYLNLRTNGLQYHMDLMNGKVAYTDAGVVKTMENWKKMIEPGYFIENHATYSWQEALPFIQSGEAAMYLLGNFIVPQFGDYTDKMGFFQFPVIDESVPMAEDAPMDTAHIPSKAKNKEDARKFLRFIARADVQTKINAALQQIPPHKDAKAKQDPFLDKGVAVLGAAAGTAQFYDRDTSPAMAKEGMKGFQEFMVKPERMDKILKRLEKVRQREFK